MRVSRSGGWMSVIRPHSNRERSRSSSVEISRGGRSERDHDLPAGLVERVEGVEELLLDPLLVLEELDVVDQQQVVGPVALLEALDPLVAERVDEVVHERLARDVADGELSPRVLADVLADGLEEMGLSEPGAPVDEERVVRLGRRFRHGQRGGVREAVRRADHERVERVLLAHLEPRARRRLGLRHRPRRLDFLLDREPNPPLAARCVADGRTDQIEEMPFDPLAREVVRHREDERVVGELST